MKINKLHFLVHPGASFEFRREFGPEILPTGQLEDERELMTTYQEKIDGLDENDILVIFSPSTKRTYLSDLKSGEEWTSIERYARSRLGNRCIALSDPDFLSSPGESGSLDRLLGILNRRGFDFTEDTPSEVWGTCVQSCVIDTADEVFKQFKLKNYPVIPARATDLKNLTQQEIERLEDELRSGHPKVKLVDRV